MRHAGFLWSSEMQREALKRLLDAYEAIAAIERFTDNCPLDVYLDNELIQSAVERKFEIIGEALKRALETDPDVLNLIPELHRIVGTRNRIIHEYEAVDQLILWDSIQNDLPGLRRTLLVVLELNPPLP
ncbi:DUF86 domain-containing protein [Cyanobium sp. FGCU-6]|jgi:uncharacterized protein with HEPN domain|nr:DUF86 domain-containing protein [Cyanobium sp. FGCU6]